MPAADAISRSPASRPSGVARVAARQGHRGREAVAAQDRRLVHRAPERGADARDRPAFDAAHPVEELRVLRKREVVQEGVAAVEEAREPARGHVAHERRVLLEVELPRSRRLARERRHGEDALQVLECDWCRLHRRGSFAGARPREPEARIVDASAASGPGRYDSRLVTKPRKDARGPAQPSLVRADDLRSFGHRSRTKQIGLRPDDFSGKPVIAILNTWSDVNTCHAHFRARAEEVKRGVWQAGGFPVEMPVLSLGETFMKPTHDALPQPAGDGGRGAPARQPDRRRAC